MQITIEVPAELLEDAQAADQSPEQFASDLLTSAIERNRAMNRLRKLAKAPHTSKAGLGQKL